MLKIRGFSLLELMVVLVIISILTSIAVPAFRDSAVKSRRNDAQAALISFASALERKYTETGTYCNNGTVSITSPSGHDCIDSDADGDTGAPTIFSTTAPIDGTSVNYNLIIRTVDRAAFEIRAERTGSMLNDECGDFVLTQTGQKSQVNSSEVCW
jgi:type IV pilus assembly protein PilE